MKDLSKFDSVKNALAKVVAESDVNNGTQGLTLLAYFWEQEYIYDKDRQDLQTKIAQKLLSGSVEGVKELQKQLEGLPKPKIVMHFKLLEPIKRIQGTKIMHDGDNTHKISMDNVMSIFIPEDAVTLGLLEYEETEEIMKDSQGRDSTVIKLHIKKGLIDVAAPILGRGDKEIRPKRAYVTAISYRTMQTAGELMNRERMNKRRRYGFDMEQ